MNSELKCILTKKKNEQVDGQTECGIEINDSFIICFEWEFTKILFSVIRAYDEIKYLKMDQCKHNCSLDSADITIINYPKWLNLKINYKEDVITCWLKEKVFFSLCWQEYCGLVKMLYEGINNLYGNGMYDFRIFNSIYLEHMLGVDLPYLMSSRIEYVDILSLRAYSKTNPDGISINKHHFFCEILNNCCTEDIKLKNNFLYETNFDRMKRNVLQIKEFGYPYNNQYIIVYNDEMIVRDGEHRLACLYYLFGNIRIPIMRLKFKKNYYTYELF